MLSPRLCLLAVLAHWGILRTLCVYYDYEQCLHKYKYRTLGLNIFGEKLAALSCARVNMLPLKPFKKIKY